MFNYCVRCIQARYIVMDQGPPVVRDAIGGLCKYHSLDLQTSLLAILIETELILSLSEINQLLQFTDCDIGTGTISIIPSYASSSSRAGRQIRTCKTKYFKSFLVPHGYPGEAAEICVSQKCYLPFATEKIIIWRFFRGNSPLKYKCPGIPGTNH